MKKSLFGFRTQSNNRAKANEQATATAITPPNSALSEPESVSVQPGSQGKSADPVGSETHPMERDGAFLQRLKQGDAAAWEELLDEWNPKLYTYMCYNTRTAEDAKDVMSETMLGLVQSIQGFDGKVNLSTFIYSIAYRKVADYWRKAKRAREFSLSPDAANFHEDLRVAPPTSLRIEFHEAFAKLPRHAQQALWLRYHEGFSVAEVAEILGRSYKATESLLSRVRRQFQYAFLGAEA